MVCELNLSKAVKEKQPEEKGTAPTGLSVSCHPCCKASCPTHPLLGASPSSLFQTTGSKLEKKHQCASLQCLHLFSQPDTHRKPRKWLME